MYPAYLWSLLGLLASMEIRARQASIRYFGLDRPLFLPGLRRGGAKASAALYSIVSTARANGLEPYAYLRRLFAALPKAKTVEDFEALLPFNTPPII